MVFHLSTPSARNTDLKKALVDSDVLHLAKNHENVLNGSEYRDNFQQTKHNYLNAALKLRNTPLFLTRAEIRSSFLKVFNINRPRMFGIIY